MQKAHGWLVTCIVILVMACSKRQEPISAKTTTSLDGSWELRKQEFTQVAGSSGIYPAGNGNRWRFQGTHFDYYVGGNLEDSGQYATGKDTFPPTRQLLNVLFLHANFSQGLFYAFSQDTLIIYRGNIAADGTIDKYVKVN